MRNAAYQCFRDNQKTQVTREDVDFLVRHMRSEDRAEARAFVGPCSPDIHVADLWEACVTSDMAAVIYLPGTVTPMALYGAGSFPEFPGVGFIWMHGTPDIAGAGRWAFLRSGRYGVAELQGKYALLVCYADSRNTLHTRWLRWMGFTPLATRYFHDPLVPFLEFVLPGTASIAAQEALP